MRATESIETRNGTGTKSENNTRTKNENRAETKNQRMIPEPRTVPEPRIMLSAQGYRTLVLVEFRKINDIGRLSYDCGAS